MNLFSSSLAYSSSSSSFLSKCSDDELYDCKKPKYDVFMNYSFQDVGKSFVSHLQEALRRNGFVTFNHTMLPTGEDACSLKLLKAIEESEIYLLVFSINYASSVRSPDELVKIMDCIRIDFDLRKVLPVFFNVEPSHVRSQRGSFEEAFQAHATNFDVDRVQKWKQAVKQAGGLSGCHLQNGDEAKFISEIIQELEKMQSPQELHVTDHPVGITSRVEELTSKLRLDSEEVLVVAVWGISGIGKMTIVKATYNRIAAEFQARCFLADIHDHCRKRDWKVKLQKKLVSNLTQNDKLPIVRNQYDGVTKIRKLISHLKVLLVLDDVDHFQQVEALGIHPEYLHDGSRIIVTTRDKQCLGNLPYVFYHTLMLLDRRESLNLFTQLLFTRNDPVNTKFIEEVVRRAGGLPLVVKVWSCHFKQYVREQWPSILETLKKIPHGDVQKQLQISYDPLPNRSKKLFLDIACFFEGMEKDLVVKVLRDEDSEFFPYIEIQYLVDKCLVQTDGPQQNLRMNHAIKKMGHEIVRLENEDEPGMRTRLMGRKDVVRVLTKCWGTESVECIILDYYDDYFEEGKEYERVEATVQVEALRKMTNLRLINFANVLTWTCSDDEGMSSLSFRKLKYLEWYGFPFKSINNIDMANVVVMRLQESKLEILCQGFKSLNKLQILDLTNSSSLIKTGSFEGLKNLEKLHLRKCVNLEKLHSSIGYLHKLIFLDLNDCPKLGSEDLQCLVKIVGLKSLRDLWMGDCKVSRVPSEIENLVALERLDLSGSTFSSLPDSFGNLSLLVTLWLNDCPQLRLLPLLPSSLTGKKATRCPSLDVMPFDSTERTYIFRTNAFNESLAFTKPLVISLSGSEEVPHWCSHYWNRGDDVLSFVAPMHLDKKIYGIILCANSTTKTEINTVRYPTFKMFNETKKTSHCLGGLAFGEEYSRCVMFCRLDDITLVEAGDTVSFQLVGYRDDIVTRFYRCGLRLIYDGDVVDSKLLLRSK